MKKSLIKIQIMRMWKKGPINFSQNSKQKKSGEKSTNESCQRWNHFPNKNWTQKTNETLNEIIITQKKNESMIGNKTNNRQKNFLREQGLINRSKQFKSVDEIKLIMKWKTFSSHKSQAFQFKNWYHWDTAKWKLKFRKCKHFKKKTNKSFNFSAKNQQSMRFIGN